jgi:hypothetical protein
MANLIASDSHLTEEQSRTLRLVQNLLIPADIDRGMPGAGELDFIGYVSEFASGSMNAITAELDKIIDASENRHGAKFAELASNEQQELLEQLESSQPHFAVNLQVQTLSCYYQDDSVMEALGMEARPPFPEGNKVVSGDLSLLDPVRNRGKIYRDA